MTCPSNSKCLTRLLCNGFILIIAFSMLFGCKTSNYGRFKSSLEVEKIFKSGQVLSGHQYYYSGSNTNPDAVMGIHQNYALDDEFWNKAGDIQKELKSWVEQININLMASGYYIMTPDGKKIGVYYSPWSTGPVKMGDNNQVIIHLPDKESDTRRVRMGKE